MEDSSKNDAGMNPPGAQKAFTVQVNNNSFSSPTVEPHHNQRIGSSTNGSNVGMISDLITNQPILTG